LVARAIDAVPRDNMASRDRWKSAVLASELSAATKVVAIVIADFYINRDPRNRHSNWAWAAQGTLARAGGLSRCTVAAAMDELLQALRLYCHCGVTAAMAEILAPMIFGVLS
jgi:hypothetical protein